METLLQIIGSLGLFLFGMRLMSDSLQKIAGERLRSIMRTMTGNRFKGIFSGLLVTTAVQSSSATTVMVVSFVNAGLLKLREAIGVIMGANLGTTVTAWIIAYFAFTFSLSQIALPIVGVGMIIAFAAKRQNIKTFGEFLVGFGLLFMAMSYLKDSVPDINAHPEMLEFIKSYSHLGFLSILIFLLFGVVLTLVVQASAVAMAITMTMVMKGWIDFDLAAAIVLGENIGTTTTAILASMGGNTNAKRAAFAHMCFNIIGVIWMLFVFAPFTGMVNDIVNGWFSASRAAAEATGQLEVLRVTGLTEKLALFHTMFNAINILVLVGFVPQLERLVCCIIKSKPNERSSTPYEHLEYLSNHFTEMGELCLFEGQKEVVKLAEMSTKMFNGFTDIFQKPDEDLSDQINELRKIEEDCDKLAYALTNFFIQCTSHELSEQSTNTVVKNMVIIAELEDMSDCCYRLITLARKRYRKQFKDHMLQSPAFVQFCEEIDKFLLFAHRMLLQQNITPEDLENAIKTRTMLDKIRKSIRKEVIAEIELGAASAKGGILFIEILGQCEKIGAHSMNILEALQNPSMLFAGPKIAKGQPVLQN